MTKDETNGLEQLDGGSRISTLLSQLNEQVYLISNALGVEEAKEGKGKQSKGKLNLNKVTQSANKPIPVVKQVKKTLMPTHMIYKDEEAPVEDLEEPEDSQDKELESTLENALAALKRYKHTLKVPLVNSLTPNDERV
tara:strand:+ start:6702 stop:7115 length:414 start_codon:yes stop_codon:yes gene_type:complete